MQFNKTRPHVGFDIELNSSMPRHWALLDFVKDDDSELCQELKNIYCHKYADVDYARTNCNSDLVRTIIDNAPIENRHKRVLVDIKVHSITKGQYACTPGWHLDGSINPKGLEKKPEIHHIFVASKHALTEFVDTPVDLEVNPTWNFAQISKNVGAALNELVLPVFMIPSCHFITYDDTFFHRGAQATGDELRLLVRVTETDIIEPQNRIYTPYTHKVLHKDDVGLIEATYHK